VCSSDLLVLVFSLIVFIYRVKKPYLVTAWLCYGVMLAPVLGVLQVGSQAAADRYTYLPSLAFFFPLSIGVVALAGNRKGVQTVLFTVIILGLGCMTVHQQALWRNSITLWESVVAVYPDVSQTAHANLGDAYNKAGRPDDALREYDRAIAIQPPQAFIHDDKGIALLNKGLWDKAIIEFKTAIDLDPRYAVPHRNLWLAYRQTGMKAESIVEIKKAIELDPSFTEAYSNLGMSLGEMGRFEESEDILKKALSLDPNNPLYLLNLGTTYQLAGHWDEAVELYKKGIAINARDLNCWIDLGNTYFLMDRFTDAAAAFQTALTLAPGQPVIQGKLAAAISKASQTSASLKHPAKP
jgi:tetratricopeptide (TPR) repeat protein